MCSSTATLTHTWTLSLDKSANALMTDQKPRVNGQVRVKLKAWTGAYNEHRISRYVLRTALTTGNQTERHTKVKENEGKECK